VDVQDLRPIKHDHPRHVEGGAAAAGIAFGAIAVAVVLGGKVAGAIAVAAVAAVVVWRVWTRLHSPLPRAIDLTTSEPLEEPIALLVDTIVASALEADADTIRFCDHAGGVAVFFDRPEGTRRALMMPFELGLLLVDELACRAGIRPAVSLNGEVTLRIGERPIHMTVRLTPGDELASVDLLRLWS
jgi:hypothetical protein